MAKFPFTFDIVYFTEFYNDRNHYRRECGFGIASSFSDAVAILERCYGDDLITINHLSLHEESELIYITPETMNTYIRQGEPGYGSYECDVFGEMITEDFDDTK